MKVWLSRDPWNDTFDLRLAYTAGRHVRVAAGVDSAGQIIWSESDELAEVPPFLRLHEDVVAALGRALGEITQASDQTVASLKDTQEVRDRLLTLVETVLNRGGTN